MEPEMYSGPDTADLIDPDADDPTPEPLTDPEHPSYVEPAADAVPAPDVSRETSEPER